MKNRRIISALTAILVVGLLFGTAGQLLGGLRSEAAQITSYSVGDEIEFGWYPQSEVKDGATIDTLNSVDGEWVSYGYYSDEKPEDYMKYKDVLYGGNMYRAVLFSKYRPSATGGIADDNAEYDEKMGYYDDNQAYNGYYVNTIYWFKYDPIVWTVLDPAKGLVVSKTILDSQAYNNTIYAWYEDDEDVYYQDNTLKYYANNYYESSIRKWLNEDFLNSAFSAEQQNMIQVTALDNSASGSDYSKYDSQSSNDKIYLLSTREFNKGYGNLYDSSTEDMSVRLAYGSDYAKAQGLWARSRLKTSYRLLRSASYSSKNTCFVSADGQVFGDSFVSSTKYGVAPAINLDLSSEIIQASPEDLIGANDPGPQTTQPTTQPANEPTSVPTSEPTTQPTQTDNIFSFSGEGITSKETEKSLIYASGTALTKSALVSAMTVHFERAVITVEVGGFPVVDEAPLGTGALFYVYISDADEIAVSKTIIFLGDVDGDATVNATDARLALRAAAKLDTLEGAFASAADTDGDNNINATDARMILRAAAKLDDPVGWLA
ncbi:MAG: dockerin type I repeat-containing protein [Clostridiales bacterium]|nr:dockerin type I repeat-containing protein [Clostridiales bacterium]